MKVKEAYDKWSESYDSTGNKTRDLEKKVARKILSNYEFDNVIELGCGTGKNTGWLAERSKSVKAIDFSSEMLKIAGAKLNLPNVEFMLADISQKWNIENGFADLIVCSLTLEHISNLNFIFSEGYRTLKENGKFYVCELHPFKQYGGTKANFTLDGNKIELETYTHHFSDYINAALKNGFTLSEVGEWFDEEDDQSPPRLISFIFKK